MTKEETEEFLSSYHQKIKIIKMGLEIFNRYGRNYIEEISLKYPDLEIFLDLKLHDIPTTVAKSIRSLAGLKIKFLTIHLSGGVEMINHALEARDNFLPSTKILGVSILTSLSSTQVKSIWNLDKESLFKNLYLLAKESHIDGIVCSGHELKNSLSIDKAFTQKTLKICPGIRLKDDDSHDQQRVMSPQEALKQGADYLVIGRSITLAPEKLDNPKLFT